MKRFVPKRLKRLGALLLAMALAAMMMVVPATADDEATEAARNAREGVFVIELGYQDSMTGTFTALSRGTCFLINEDTVLTCYHCAHILSSETFSDGTNVRAYMADTFGSDWEKRMKCRVYYQAGNYFMASEIGTVSNADYDYTALELDTAISNTTPLTLGETSSVDAGSDIVALGYKYDSQVIEDPQSSQFSARDVSLLSGTVNKMASAMNTDCIAHNAGIAEGCSGGPLLNSAGEVVGINFAKTYDSESNDYALNIDMVRNALDKSGIEYSTGGGTEPDTDDTTTTDDDGGSGEEVEVKTDTLAGLIAQAKGLNEDDYTEDSYAALTESQETAQDVLDDDAATQEQVDDAADDLQTAINGLKEKSGMSTTMIIVIAAVVIIVVIIIIVVVVSGGKKKKGPTDDGPVTMEPTYPPSDPYAGGSSTYPGGGSAYPGGSTYPGSGPSTAQNYNYTDVVGGGSEPTGVLNDSGLTDVLDNGAGETDVLTKAYATLTRKNGEKVTVNLPKFVIGKEQSRVTYCISGNSKVSRTHARLEQDGNSVVIIDMNSKNGTLVNGVRCEPNQKVTLKSGDRITLADEEFTITLL